MSSRKKTYTNKDLQAANAALAAARHEFNRVREAIDEREWKPKRLAHVGRCFKVRNNYSCPEKPSDYWWLYKRVVKIDGYSLVTEEFHRDRYGVITFRESSIYCNDGKIDASCIPITTAQFAKAKREHIAFVAKGPTP